MYEKLKRKGSSMELSMASSIAYGESTLVGENHSKIWGMEQRRPAKPLDT